MDVATQLTGFFPRPESVVTATRDLDRGRTTPEATDAAFRKAEWEVSAIEQMLGLEPRTGGYLTWADIFRPISAGWSGFSVGPITRWFATNTFFRQPVLHRPPERTAGAIAAALPAARGSALASQAKVILPGPYTLACLLDNKSGETLEALAYRLGRLLADEVKELHGLGYRTFQFQEPNLVVHPPTGPLAESVVTGYEAISSASHGSAVWVWTFFADAGPAWPLLARLPVSGVGVDLAETEPSSFRPLGEGKALGLGCVDPTTTLPEDPAEVVRLVLEVEKRVHPSGVMLGPGGPLDLLPWEPAQRKLEVLPAARKLLASHQERKA
jgi:5-methyltetrahydropteroyltriglutamate--homocysteine methyltransferase